MIAPVSESQWQYIFKNILSVLIYCMCIEKYLTKELIVTIQRNVLKEICRNELVESLYQTLLTFLQRWNSRCGATWRDNYWPTYHEISHYQNQFPALTWTCKNMPAPSKSSLEPSIIYSHIPRHHQPTNLNSPEAGISWNKRWSCIREGEETSWCPEVSESGGERVQHGKLSTDITQITELPPSLLYQTRTS